MKMPKYINVRPGGSVSQGKFYREGEEAILSETYVEKKNAVSKGKKSWMLASEYQKRQEAAAEESARHETPEDAVKRLKKELAKAEAINSKIKKTAEKLGDSAEDTREYASELKKAKELGYNGSTKKEAVFSWLDANDKKEDKA